MKETMPQKEQQTIVEIGANYPIYEMFEGNESMRKIKEGAPYIAINYNKEDLKTVKENKLGQAIVGDIKELPLKNNSADQIWLMNVFSDFQHILKKQPDGSKGYTMGLDDVFKELARVVKPGGKIIIGEVYPPITKTKWLPDRNYDQFGLKKEVYRGAKDVEKFIEKMGGQDYFEFTIKDFKDFNFEPFFLVLEKEPEISQITPEQKKEIPFSWFIGLGGKTIGIKTVNFSAEFYKLGEQKIKAMGFSMEDINAKKEKLEKQYNGKTETSKVPFEFKLLGW